jgi:hypothetical protein
MKTIFTLLFAAFSITFGLGQDSLFVKNPVTIQPAKHHLAHESQVVFELTIQEANKQNVEKAWDDSMEKGNKSKIIREGNKRTIETIVLEKIDPEKTYNVHAEVIESRKGTKLFVGFEDAEGNWIDPEANMGNTIGAERVLIHFGNTAYAEVLEEKMKKEESLLKDIEKERSSIAKKLTSYQKSIQSDSLGIHNARNSIQLHKDQYKTVTEKLRGQKTDLAKSSTGSDEEKKALEDLIKVSEKEQKSITKDIEKLQDEIIDLEKSISESFYEIEKLKADDAHMMDQFTQQQERIIQLKNEIFELKNT